MKLLADENFPKQSVIKLREEGFELEYILESNPGISDEDIIKKSNKLNSVIITLDSDCGELIFKYGFKPKHDVIFFRLGSFLPEQPAEILIDLLKSGLATKSRLTVIDTESVRQRKY